MTHLDTPTEPGTPYRMARIVAPALLGLAALAVPTSASALTTVDRTATATGPAATAKPDATPASSPKPPDPTPGTLTTSTPTLTQGASITFHYATTKADFDPTNWIGIYSNPGCGPVDGDYTCASTTYQYTPSTTGTRTFDTASLAPGRYIAFFLYDNEYNTLAKPVPFTVTAVTPVPAPTFVSALTPRRLDDPQAITESPDHRVWLANTGGDVVEELSATTGHRIRSLGAEGGAPGDLRDPRGVAVQGGHVWVADTGNNRVEEYTTDGTWVRAIGSIGTGPGQFEGPEGVAIDAGRLWVSDDGNNRIESFSTSTGALESTLTGEEISSPAGMSADDNGDLWVAMQGQTDTALDGVVEFGPTGRVLLALDSDNTTTYGGFDDPTDVAVNRAGDIFVAEPDLDYVQEFDPDGVYLNEFGAVGNATLSFPAGLVVLRGGRIVVADSGNDRLVTWKQS